jgi:hypothetical protein
VLCCSDPSHRTRSDDDRNRGGPQNYLLDRPSLGCSDCDHKRQNNEGHHHEDRQAQEPKHGGKDTRPAPIAADLRRSTSSSKGRSGGRRLGWETLTTGAVARSDRQSPRDSSGAPPIWHGCGTTSASRAPAVGPRPTGGRGGSRWLDHAGHRRKLAARGGRAMAPSEQMPREAICTRVGGT